MRENIFALYCEAMILSNSIGSLDINIDPHHTERNGTIVVRAFPPLHKLHLDYYREGETLFSALVKKVKFYYDSSLTFKISNPTYKAM